MRPGQQERHENYSMVLAAYALHPQRPDLSSVDFAIGIPTMAWFPAKSTRNSSEPFQSLRFLPQRIVLLLTCDQSMPWVSAMACESTKPS